MLAFAVDSWTSIKGSSVREEYHSVAAVALSLGNLQQSIDNDLHATPPPQMTDSLLGTVTTITMEEQNKARMYSLGDDAVSPHYLTNAIIRQCKYELLRLLIGWIFYE
jgi:hypothetical protein